MSRSFLIIAVFLLSLIGCSRDLPQPPDPPKATSDAPASAAAVEPAASVTLESGIPPEQIATRLELAGPPRYVAASDTLELLVRVHNDGQATLVGEGSAMVRLGAMLVGPEGPDVAPGVRDFIRAPLPLLSPGTQAEIAMSLPAQALLGLPVRLELVQEGVNWFSAYGQPSLDLGTFDRCADAAGTLCTADGQSLTP